MAIKIKGLDQLTKDLRNFGQEGDRIVVKEIGLSAQKIENDAIARLPFELNFIRQRIDKDITEGGFRAVVGVQGIEENPLPVYHEFGTGAAASSLLKGSEYDDEIRQLAWYFKRPLDGNLPASPYLFPSFFEERPKLIERLKKELDNLAKKS